MLFKLQWEPTASGMGYCEKLLEELVIVQSEVLLTVEVTLEMAVWYNLKIVLPKNYYLKYYQKRIKTRISNAIQTAYCISLSKIP